MNGCVHIAAKKLHVPLLLEDLTPELARESRIKDHIVGCRIGSFDWERLEMDLILGEKTFKVDSNLAHYNKLRKRFFNKAVYNCQQFGKTYYNCGKIDIAWGIFQTGVDAVLREGSGVACKELFSQGIYDVTEDSFLNEYYDQYMDIDQIINPIVEKLEQVEDISNQLEYQRELKKASRGRWEGGGFGLKGALAGAATASALNAAGGLLHGIGDMISSSSDNAKIRKLKA